MHTTQLLCVCSLLMVAAATQCGGGSCAADQDSATLLQSTAQMLHGGEQTEAAEVHEHAGEDEKEEKEEEEDEGVETEDPVYEETTVGRVITAQVPMADIGHVMCKFCAKKFKGSFSWNLCLTPSPERAPRKVPFVEDTGHSPLVPIDSSRRRAAETGCFAPSWAPQQGTDSGRNANRDDRLALQGKTVDNPEKFCGCMRKMLEGKHLNGDDAQSKCTDADCVKDIWCRCAGTCSSFKDALECDASLAQSLEKRSDKVSSNTSESGLDESMNDKCVE